MAEHDRPAFTGILAALATPTFLGMAPVFGKLAINVGTDPFSVAAVRTLLAVVMLWAVYILFFRKYVYIYPAGLLGCVVIGVINGIGSLFYYGGLGVLDASLVQLLNGMYLAFAILISRAGGHEADRRTLVRVILAMIALAIITGFGDQTLDWTGVGLMLGSALMFAGTVVLSQYVLYEMPAPTMALYVLTTMAVVVTMVWAAVSDPLPAQVWRDALPPIFALGATTALSRLAMFAGVKFLGGMQTAILAITEIAVALLLSFIVLGDRLAPLQWVGVGVLFLSILLIRQRDFAARGYNPALLIAPTLPSVQFQRIAFHRAFGTREAGDELGIMESVTTQEMIAIQKMMGASLGGVDPFPIGKSKEFLQMSQFAERERELEQHLNGMAIDLFETQEVELPEELVDIEED